MLENYLLNQNKNLINHFFFYLIAVCFLSTTVYAEETINISARHLEYLEKTNTYIARGSVEIIYEDATLNADEIYFNNTTFDSVAIGNVIYEDAETIIKSNRIELNLKTKLGKIYDCYIFYKKENYHIRGGDLEKIGGKSYTLNKATATTCNADPPAWKISARDIEVTRHESIKSRNTTFYIKNIPVLYTPYFYAPLLKERQTGFLVPFIGYSNYKGFTYKQGFFWVIKENKDATFYLDYYSEKGFGKGLDYRYITNSETFGELWVYHLRDNDLRRDFSEVKSYHNLKLPYNVPSYLKLHLVNEFDYYSKMGSISSQRIGFSSLRINPFGFASEERLQKYLESNLQLSKPFYGGRTYLLGQYRQSLEGSSATIPQSLPEIGLALNTRSAGPISFNVQVRGTNFWREKGQQGQRLDINPNFYLSYGGLINITQRIGFRETAYFLNNTAKNENRLLFDLSSTLTTRFFKRYSTFTHIIDPSLEYTYIPEVDEDGIPIFDSIDSISRTSNINYSLTNRFTGLGSSGLEARFRVSQGYSLLDVEKPFTPVLAEGSLLSDKIDFSINTSYDVYETMATDAIASVKLKGTKGFLGIGKNFRRATLLDQYTLEAGINEPINVPISLYGKLWYDVKGAGVQESIFKATYQSQCWGVTFSFTRRPYEYQILFGIEFKGLGAVGLGYPELPMRTTDL